MFLVDDEMPGNLPPLPGIYPGLAALAVHVRNGLRLLFVATLQKR